MAESMIVSPISRVGGQLSVQVEVDAGKVRSARIGVPSVRGIERIARGNDPGDLTFISQRVCAACGVSHAVGAATALEDAWDIRIPHNGRLLRNIAQATSMVAASIRWFYQRALPDYVDLSAIARYRGKERALLAYKEQMKALAASGHAEPYLPQDDGEYLVDPSTASILFMHAQEGVRIAAAAEEVLAIITGRSPHGPGIIPGGVALHADSSLITQVIPRLREISSWVDEVFVVDLLDLAPELVRFSELGIGVPNFLSFGAFKLDDKGTMLLPQGLITGGDVTIVEELRTDRIEEDVAFSWYQRGTGVRHPSVGETVLIPPDDEGYSYAKSARYGGRAMETGSLARLLVAQEKTMLDLTKRLRLKQSVLARMVARAVEAGLLARASVAWVSELNRDEPSNVRVTSGPDKDGVSLTESPSGALGHWLRIENGTVDSLQMVGGGTWNCSPSSGKKDAGPIEAALVGTSVKGADGLLDVLRVVRSFDPCAYCASQ